MKTIFLNIFMYLMIYNGASAAQDATLCPWDAACKYLDNQGDSLSSLGCRRFIDHNSAKGMNGDAITNYLCDDKPECLSYVKQHSQVVTTLIEGPNFKLNGTFCGKHKTSENTVSIQLYNPTKIELGNRSIPIVNSIELASRGEIVSLTPSSDLETLFFSIGPKKKGKLIECKKSKVFNFWWPITFYEDGSLHSCDLNKESKFAMPFGEIKAVGDIYFYRDGQLEAGYFKQFKYVTPGGKVYQISGDVSFYKHGKPLHAEFRDPRTKFYRYVCFSDAGETVLEDDNIIPNCRK